MQQFVIQLRDDAIYPASEPECYLKAYDPDAHAGRGAVESTSWLSRALKFQTREEAFEFWRQPSTVQPLRADGKPNRPLTAFTVTIMEVPCA